MLLHAGTFSAFGTACLSFAQAAACAAKAAHASAFGTSTPDPRYSSTFGIGLPLVKMVIFQKGNGVFLGLFVAE